MSSQTKRRGSVLSWLLVLIPAALLAAFLGALSPLLPKLLVSAFIVLLVAIPIYILRPAWLIAPVVCLQLFSPSQPAADVVTVLFLARAVVSLYGRWPEIRPVLANPLLKVLCVIGLCVLVSFFFAVTVLGVSRSGVYSDGRVYVYWLWIIAFVAWAPEKDAGRWIAMQLFGVALIVALLAILQGAFGVSLVGTGRVAGLETLGRVSSDITRVQIPGFTFVTFATFFCIAQMIWPPAGRSRWWYSVPLALFVMAIIFNFGRALWFWTFVGVAVTAIGMGWRASIRTSLWVTLFALLFGTGILLTKPEMANVVVERVASVAQEGGRGTSYGWREAENNAARSVLTDTFFMGVGLGGDYRPPVLGLTTFENHTRYIHNGHLAVLLKLSIFGYLAYVALFFLIGRQAAQLRASAAMAPLGCATIAWLVAFTGQNITQPDIMTAHSLTLLAGFVAFLLLAKRDQQAAEPGSTQRIERHKRRTGISPMAMMRAGQKW